MQFKESRHLMIAGLQTSPVAENPDATWDAFAAAVENARALFDDLDLLIALQSMETAL